MMGAYEWLLTHGRDCFLFKNEWFDLCVLLVVFGFNRYKDENRQLNLRFTIPTHFDNAEQQGCRTSEANEHVR